MERESRSPCLEGEELCKKKIKVDKLLLHDATRNDDLGEIKFLLEHGHDDYVNEQDEFKNTPLHYAISVAAAKLLIAKGADVNAKDRNGYTPLSFAYASDNIGLVHLFLKNGANLVETLRLYSLSSTLTEKEFILYMLCDDPNPPWAKDLSVNIFTKDS